MHQKLYLLPVVLLLGLVNGASAFLLADFTADGVVDFADLSVLADNWLLSGESIEGTEPDPNHILLWYKFDETSGSTATDSSSNPHNGRVIGGPDWDGDGYKGGCLSFNDDTSVEVPTDVLANIDKAITISVWLNGGNAAGRDNTVFETGDGDYFLTADVPDEDNNVRWRAGDAANNELLWFDSNSADWRDSWNHYGFVKDANECLMRIYRNGSVVAEKTGASNSLATVRNTPFDIGAKLRHKNDYIGKMDDFKIYDYALSQAEMVGAAGSGGKLIMPLNSPFDLNNDNTVNLKDFAVFAQSWAFSIQHVIVYREPGRFCGWPANSGAWSWGDEILVGFELGYYKDRGPSEHSIDPDRPVQIALARSLNGGQSWSLEISQDLARREAIPCPGGVNFTHPDFSMRCSSSKFHLSYDRGKTWEGPYRLPDFGQSDIMARTDYIVNDQNNCLIFLTASKTDGREGRVFCARTIDGAESIQFVSWIGPEPSGYAIMPSSVRVSESQLICAIRRYERGDINRGWIDVYVSNDDSATWEFLSKAADTGGSGGNPPSMLKLSDGRICVTYGYRSRPYGIRAKISSDNGQTWSEEIILRQEGRNWDLGYTRTVQRPDGKLVTMYYFSQDESPEQYIATTIWDPNLLLAQAAN